MKKTILGVGIAVVIVLIALLWYRQNTLAPMVPPSVPTDTYQAYLSRLDTICPFGGTAVTSDCLDEKISAQKQRYDALYKKIMAKAQSESSLQVSLQDYTKEKDSYIERLCSVKNFSTTGTAIVEESRKCAMYYNAKDIEMLEAVWATM